MTDQPDRLTYDFSEVCHVLGVNEHTIRRWMRLPVDPLPHVRAGDRGGRVVFPCDAVRRWINAEADNAALRVRVDQGQKVLHVRSVPGRLPGARQSG